MGAELDNLIRDRATGQSRGFAFVEMENEGEADQAISALNGYTLDGRAHSMDGRQISGDLGGSRWHWEISGIAPGRTRVRYTTRARNFSRVVDALEDAEQTVTAGLNVGAVVTMLRALKRRCEIAS